MSSVEQPGIGQGPWTTAVQQAFSDDPVLAARVGQFMTTHYQPYVTRLENERASGQQAQEFYNAFQADPGEAFLSLAEDMFGEEGVSSIVNALQDEPEETAIVPENEPAPQYAQLSPEDAELIEWARGLREERQEESQHNTYLQDKSAFLADEARKHIDAELFDPFVAANDGDWEKAATAYEAFHNKFAPPAEPDPAAPATLPGSAPTPQVEQKYSTFDDAWDAFEAEQRALKPAPPTV